MTGMAFPLVSIENCCQCWNIVRSKDKRKILPQSDWTIPKDDFFLEMLEVLINSIIYVRNVYPASIFKQQKMYNTSCYICIYPPLREYIQNVLKTAISLKRKDELYKIDLIFEKDEATLEMFSFGVFFFITKFLPHVINYLRRF